VEFYDRADGLRGSRCWAMLHTMKFTDSIDEHFVRRWLWFCTYRICKKSCLLILAIMLLQQKITGFVAPKYLKRYLGDITLAWMPSIKVKGSYTISNGVIHYGGWLE
jgi:hypothetical protein